MNQVNWDDLKVFHTLAAGKSVRSAASLLGIHHSTVARRLEQLEERLGVLLFTRTPRGLKLTREGEAIVISAERVEQEVEEIQRRVAGSDKALAGPVRITLPDAMAGSFLMQEFARFSQSYPDIELEFLPSYALLDIGQREADIAIRATSKPPEHLIGRRLGSFSVTVYASREYMREHDPQGAPESCNWIAWSHVDDRFREFKAHEFPQIPVKTLCNNASLRLAAVEAGMGLAVLPCAMGDSHKDLVRVSRREPVLGQEIWLLTHPDLRNTARVRVLSAFIVEAFRNSEAALLGDLSATSRAA